MVYSGKRVLAVIPARGGSKGLPGKNIMPLCGKPMIIWSIEQGLRESAIDKVVVNTDDLAIAAVARAAGADVPYLRPEHLSGDCTPVGDVLFHMQKYYDDRDEHYDILMLLECSSPIRFENDLREALRILVDQPDTHSVVGMVPVTHEHPAWAFREQDGYCIGFSGSEITAAETLRQGLLTAYLPYSIYCTWWDQFKEHRLFYQTRTRKLPLRREQMFEVDDEFDHFMTECVMRRLKMG